VTAAVRRRDVSCDETISYQVTNAVSWALPFPCRPWNVVSISEAVRAEAAEEVEIPTDSDIDDETAVVLPKEIDCVEEAEVEVTAKTMEIDCDVSSPPLSLLHWLLALIYLAIPPQLSFLRLS